MKRYNGYEWMQTEEYKRKVKQAHGTWKGDVVAAICALIVAAFVAISAGVVPHGGAL